MTAFDPYRVLQVREDADSDVIKAAWRTLAKRYHPDVNPSPEAQERIREINHAFDILGCEETRSAFQRERERDPLDFDSFFEEMWPPASHSSSFWRERAEAAAEKQQELEEQIEHLTRSNGLMQEQWQRLIVEADHLQETIQALEERNAALQRQLAHAEAQRLRMQLERDHVQGYVETLMAERAAWRHVARARSEDDPTAAPETPTEDAPDSGYEGRPAISLLQPTTFLVVWMSAILVLLTLAMVYYLQ